VIEQNIKIIGEIGVNHNGDLDKALTLIDVAVEAKIDIVKFQTFIPENMITKYAQKADYQKRDGSNKESQYDLLKKYTLSKNEFETIFNYCREKEINFLSSAFDLESLEFLLELGMNQIKIPSGEITNFPLLKKISTLNYPIYLSTGMCNLDEIQEAYNLLIEGGTDKKNICVMQCTTMYPTPINDVNLNVLKTFKNIFGDNIGFSDHTTGFVAAIVAVANGAKVIEKHFTLDKNMEGPDHRASLEPKQLVEFANFLREIPLLMGSYNKLPNEVEILNRELVRKSIVANCRIEAGEKFTELNIGIKRPGNGMSPLMWNKIVGNISNKNYEKDEMIFE
jgi:N,N'-diacetyllegionaminate synthase